jgi:hypothetical protein
MAMLGVTSVAGIGNDCLLGVEPNGAR